MAGNVRPIDSAPHDGRKVTVLWTDEQGVENRTLAQYRAPDRLRASGGDWDDNDGGWWAYVDSTTQKRIEPHSWLARDDADGED